MAGPLTSWHAQRHCFGAKQRTAFRMGPSSRSLLLSLRRPEPREAHGAGTRSGEGRRASASLTPTPPPAPPFPLRGSRAGGPSLAVQYFSRFTPNPTEPATLLSPPLSPPPPRPCPSFAEGRCPLTTRRWWKIQNHYLRPEIWQTINRHVFRIWCKLIAAFLRLHDWLPVSHRGFSTLGSKETSPKTVSEARTSHHRALES